MRLEGKTVLVTGSATGIGEGIARRIAAEGGRPVIHGRDEERQAGQRVAEETGGLLVLGELSDAETPARLVAEAIDGAGRLDGVVNNAGVSWRGGIDAPVELFDSILAINARAPFLICQAAYPHLKANGGAIVNITSSLARRGAPNMVPYSMSKAAVVTMTKALSGEFASAGVRINALNLGWTLTPNERDLNVRTNGWEPDWPDAVDARQPLGRLLRPEDIAPMVAYLLSSESGMITGQVWDFDQHAPG